MQPSLSPMARDHGREVLERRIRPGMSEYMGQPTRRSTASTSGGTSINSRACPPRSSAGFWGGSDFDLDVAGVDLDGSGIFGECKWTAQPIGMGILGKLRRRVEEVRYGGDGPGRHLLLFGRSGKDRDDAALLRCFRGLPPEAARGRPLPDVHRA
ncbi:hypothetical protein [Methylorubrum aminovorans]